MNRHPHQQQLHMQAFYEGLFTSADITNSGQINGRDAVTFLSRSKLPVDVLKNIWNMADQNPKTNQLDKKKFFVAVRLIQLFQNGQKFPGSDLSKLPDPSVVLRPPYFEGVTDAPSQQQPPQQPSQQQSIPVATPIRPGLGSNQPSVSNLAPAPTSPGTAAQPQRPVLHYTQSTATVATTNTTVSRMPQQQPPPPQPQPTPQQQQPPPISPQRNMALTQDPYNMTPVEKARYESLFPQYAKDDGYVYGKEAVELFMKSGLEQTLLRTIWNMVDYPVDNKLSMLEFSMAMHLIVCVSKKNLPMPVVFPPSLKAMKDQELAAAAGVSGGSVASGNPGDNPAGNQPPPAAQQQQQPAPPAAAMSIPSPPLVTAQPSSPSQQLQQQQQQAPPPQPQQPPQPSFNVRLNIGGMSISDAFENVPSHDTTTPPTDASFETNTTMPTNEHTSTVQPPPPVPNNPPDNNINATMYATQPPPTSNSSPPSIHGIQSHDATSTSTNSADELSKLQTIFQKLQAENVSLKAQLGQFTDEEMSVRKEITQTVSEISTLSMELNTLRSQVVDAKSSLIEATSELRAQIEKRE